MMAAKGPLGRANRVREAMVLSEVASVMVAVEALEDQAPGILQMPSGGPMVLMTGHVLSQLGLERF